ncbi:MAG TPA: hypothetical protein VIZ60_07620 [Rubrobacter sp.]
MRADGPEAESVRTTPEPLSAMRRAAALAVKRWVVMPVTTELMKSSRDISTSGINCTSRIEMALKETSTLPACFITSPMCFSTACSSRVSTRAV